MPPNNSLRRLDKAVWERVARDLSGADLRRWTEEAIEAERSNGVDSIKAGITEIRRH